MTQKREDCLIALKRVIVKIGTSTLTHSTGLLNLDRIEGIVRQLSNIHNKGIQVVLVTSGAIGAGMGKLGFKSKPKTIPEKQAAAAIGQGILLHMYNKLFSEYGKSVAQILLTKDVISNRTSFLNARNSFFTLLDRDIIPIVNENDAVAIDEIKFGDNDTLSAMVTNLIEGDLLILLTDIDGLYDSNPKINPEAKLIKNVQKITKEIKSMAGEAGSSFGTGGMITKIKAAELSIPSGASVIIANGSIPNVLNKIIDGDDIGTYFEGRKNTLQSKKYWLAYNATPKGKVIIDDGAREALVINRKSLLPAGINYVQGTFSKGEIISVIDSNGLEVARGITNYTSFDIDQIKGTNSSSIRENLGYKSYDEVIHANNLVIVNRNYPDGKEE
ncbi:glutamate 5-kinase [Oceanirhabdus sp. W0125-5]|uniref:glutamate 5-kinase n=1 Tax=Oceanirhabdus sp. W0125-5 TaxID=2999116 RepID=UPI0022F32FC5|nr:glutamate 5-kinase [Oceanirhabdus sp. W0125-5]WBW95607.1 glutamate 5-kinase [Oceanirhabdus sp. W0125-5]